MSTGKKRIMWVDDEIEHLRPHIIFLEERGYSVTPVSNGHDAIGLLKKEDFDIIFLDEIMAGLDGISTLELIRKLNPRIPVIMITKSEEENIMEEAIGKEITDYLIKPVNPLQIVSTLKRIFEKPKLVEERITRDYTGEYQQIASRISPLGTPNDWLEVANWIGEWNVILDAHPELGLYEAHRDFEREANAAFGSFIEKNYLGWLSGKQSPTLSPDIAKKYIFPHLRENRRVFFVVVDCMRYDQWLTILPLLDEYYNIKTELYYSILPTATPYSRNALFSGLFPSELAKKHPELWTNIQGENQNRLEHQLLDRQILLAGIRLKGATKYVKILDPAEGERTLRNIAYYLSAPLCSIVVNFLDLLAHGRVSSEVLKEIAYDEKSFRGVMKSWFAYSHLFEMLKIIAKERDAVVVFTSDHGSTFGKRATRVLGKKDTSPSLRYKFGDNLNCNTKEALFIRNPEAFKLPAFTMTTTYVIAKEDFFFVYPTNFSEYEKMYKNSILHGGISIEEMIIPVATLTPR